MTAAIPTHHLLLRSFCDELARCGMTDACTSPGSRSAPLVLPLVRETRIRSWSHIDERCAGFFAIGLAKATGRPVAIACTSGTAAANLAPPVHEAREARVPLVVLTADRPAELREIGAGQTIDQIKLYGTAAKWFFEVGVDDASEAGLRWVRQLACRAYWTALEESPGVVHLNFPLREPLTTTERLPHDSTGRADGKPFVALESASPVPRSSLDLSSARRGVVVAGRADDPAPGAAAAAFAAAAGWPVLADPLSGGRRGEAAIAHYDALLRDERITAELRPDLVLRTGDLPTSKPLRGWLSSLDGVRQLAIDSRAAWQDPTGSIDRIAPIALGDLDPPPTADDSWLARWQVLDEAAAGAIDETLGDALSEPAVARELGRALRSDAVLFVASSMPVRDVETFFPARDDSPRVLANRGANGIDGTVSSAFGVAAAGVRTVLLVGDVALLHDVGGLLAHRRLGLDLTIVVLNNDGGGIFNFLPVAEQDDAFESHVATPHGTDLAGLAAVCGFEHALVTTAAELRAGIESGGSRILEVQTERGENVELHRRVWDAVSRRARAAAPRA